MNYTEFLTTTKETKIINVLEQEKITKLLATDEWVVVKAIPNKDKFELLFIKIF